jgi:hypothetical protein
MATAENRRKELNFFVPAEISKVQFSIFQKSLFSCRFPVKENIQPARDLHRNAFVCGATSRCK